MFRSRRSGAPGPDGLDAAVGSPQDLNRRLSANHAIWSPVEMQPTCFSTPFGDRDSPFRRTSFGARFRRRSTITGQTAPTAGAGRRRLSSVGMDDGAVSAVGGRRSIGDGGGERPPSTEPPAEGTANFTEISAGHFPREYANQLGLFYCGRGQRYVPRFNMFVKPKLYDKPVDLDDVLEITKKYLDTKPVPRKKLDPRKTSTTSNEECDSEGESPASEDSEEETADEPMDTEASPTAYVEMKLVQELIMQRYRRGVTDGIVPHFRNLMDRWMDEKTQKVQQFPVMKAFARMISDTHAIIRAWMMPEVAEGDFPRLFDLPRDSEHFDELSYMKICAELQGILHSQFADVCQDFMAELYGYGFSAHGWHTARAADKEASLSYPPFMPQCVADLDGPDCWCGSCVHDDFMLINLFLRELQLTECFAGEHVYKLLRNKIFTHVKESLLGSHDVRQIDRLISWMTGSVMSWIDCIYAPHVPAYRDSKIWDLLDAEARQKLRGETNTRRKLIVAQLTEYLYKCAADILMKNIFSIIVEFPDSQPALEDLRDCLQNLEPKTKRDFIANVRNVLCSKLLQPGVLTHDILTGYVSAIKALRFVDPSGVILLEACNPIRAYLRGRPDTVKRIVVSLTDTRSGELADELANSDLNAVGVAGQDWHDEDENDAGAVGMNTSMDQIVANRASANEAEDWELWEPEKWDVRPEHGSKAGRQADIITMLVNIYGSRKVFMQEYMKILASRILEDVNFDLEREIRCKEFLKLRFGETYLHNCEVMLRDVQESQRMNLLVCSEERVNTKEFEVKALIRSVQFWPEMPLGESIALPEHIMKELDEFRGAFEVMKGSRTLAWDTQLGEVKIKVELKDRTLDVIVKPIMACIIMHFAEKKEWELKELSEKLKVAPAYLKRKLRFWQARKVIRETQPDSYVQFETVAEWQEADRRCFASIPSIAYYDNDDEVERECAADVGVSKLDSYWSYIVGMLTNIKTLPLNRIHSMLRMFAMQNASVEECSIDELRAYLHEKVCSQQLLYINGMFRLPTAQ